MVYHLEMGGMALHDAVEVNCKKNGTTENHDAGAKYMGYGVDVGWLFM